MKRFLTSLAIAGGMAAGSASAAVVLPDTTGQVRFEGISAFATAFQPFINLETGDLLPALESDGPLTVTAFGEINSILDADNSNNKGTISGELTFTYTGAQLTPLTVSAGVFTDTSVTYTVTSRVVGGVIRMFDDVGGANLNTANYFGDPATIPPEALDGTLYLEANTPAQTFAHITITFLRADPTSDFSAYTIVLQGLNSGEFNITGGSILAEHPDLFGKAIQVSQDGLVNVPEITPEDVVIGETTVTRNQAVDQLVEGDVVLITEFQVIPEPASLVLMLAGVAMVAGPLGRKRHA
jgi:hypothetical protein